MANYTAYPTETDLLRRIEDLGIITQASAVGFDLTAKVEAAARAWERDTGHQPFLAAGSDSTRYFDPPRRSCRLDLDTGLASLTSLSVDGTAYTVNDDFYISPRNASSLGQAITAIEFTSPVSGEPRSIAIVGRWGYATDLHADAWEAILVKALLLCLPELMLGISKGLYSMQDETFSIRYGGGGVTPLMAEEKVWAATYKSAVRRYQRCSL